MKQLAETLGILNEIPTGVELDGYFIFDPNISADEAKRRNAEIVECNVCGVTGNRPNMMRWHFENCKVKLRECQQCGGVIPITKASRYSKSLYCSHKCFTDSKIGKAPLIMTDEIKKKLSASAKLRSEESSIRMKKNKVWLKSGRWKK
jgi:hypothetical protein